MARCWSRKEENQFRSELQRMYIHENLPLKEVARILGLAESTVFQRLRRLGIATQPSRKLNYLKKRNDIILPVRYSGDVAEFVGIMMGDGHLTRFQTVVTLGNKELEYVNYVRFLIEKMFGVLPNVSIRKTGHRDIYLGSVMVVKWLLSEGLVFNKVKSQVDVPLWIFETDNYMKRFIRGFFDTDGSIYKLRYGIQIELTNYSEPLLHSLQNMLLRLGYRVSRVSTSKVYITRVVDVVRFFKEIQPHNMKHVRRFENLIRNAPVG